MADLVLITQCVYYNTRNKRRAAARRAQAETSEVSEDSPLLRRQDSSPIEATGSSTKDVMAQSEADTRNPNSLASNVLSLVAVYVVGIVAWFISYKAGAWDADEPAPDAPEEANNPLEWAGLTLGYTSAVLYLW